MLVRRIARPLLAAWFVTEGIEAARRPGPHVSRAQAAWTRVGARLDLPAAPPAEQLRLLVRLHGVAMVVSALMLARGKHPRTAALGLVALTIPLAVANQPFAGGDIDRAGRRERFVRNLSMIGGALIAGIDREGRPGIAWRAQHARVDHAAARQAKLALASAAQEARTLARQARRAAG